MSTPITPAAAAALAAGSPENFVAATTPGGIEKQEKEGQAALTHTFNRLPIDGMNAEALVMLGFAIGPRADDLFQSVVPPEGWQLKPTDHAMWSDIIDDKGRVRGHVFYKAAFYDQRAHMSLSTRYRLNGFRELDPNDMHKRRVVVEDHDGTVLFDAGSYAMGEYERKNALDATAEKWLLEHYPEAKSIAAYWE